MKKIITLFVFASFALTSCSKDGPVGPQGPPGPEGLEGVPGADGLIGTVIELEPINFTADNNYEALVNFDDNGVEVFESDAILVYLKTGEDGEADGAPVDVFRQLPQTYYIDNEQLQYNFNYTYFSVLLFLDGTVDFGTLNSAYTDNQVFRIVVVPAGFATTTGVDVSSMKAVMNALNVKEADVKKIKD